MIGLILWTLIFWMPSGSAGVIAQNSPVAAKPAPENHFFGRFEANYCVSVLSEPNFFLRRAQKVEYQIGLSNAGGLLNGGVCWWHSRLQRAVFYLAILDPSRPRVRSKKQVLAILRSLTQDRKPTVIPGYRSVSEFMGRWNDVVKNYLLRWQLRDGLLKQYWLKGVRGRWKGDPEQLWASLEQAVERVNADGDIIFQRLQYKGVGAHSWLVVGGQQIIVDGKIKGFSLDLVDSVAGINPFHLKMSSHKETIFYDKLQENIFPSTDFDWEIPLMRESVQDFCH